mmetsp:Transcript_56327/g.133738  ORF Transcript_56327/g.133738 Transcript_56327/m.133738 type:complete len:488 (+) Transcript_56327:171-1634(+)
MLQRRFLRNGGVAVAAPRPLGLAAQGKELAAEVLDAVHLVLQLVQLGANAVRALCVVLHLAGHRNRLVVLEVNVLFHGDKLLVALGLLFQRSLPVRIGRLPRWVEVPVPLQPPPCEADEEHESDEDEDARHLCQRHLQPLRVPRALALARPDVVLVSVRLENTQLLLRQNRLGEGEVEGRLIREPDAVPRRVELRPDCEELAHARLLLDAVELEVDRGGVEDERAGVLLSRGASHHIVRPKLRAGSDAGVDGARESQRGARRVARVHPLRRHHLEGDLTARLLQRLEILELVRRDRTVPGVSSEVLALVHRVGGLGVPTRATDYRRERTALERFESDDDFGARLHCEVRRHRAGVGRDDDEREERMRHEDDLASHGGGRLVCAARERRDDPVPRVEVRVPALGDVLVHRRLDDQEEDPHEHAFQADGTPQVRIEGPQETRHRFEQVRVRLLALDSHLLDSHKRRGKLEDRHTVYDDVHRADDHVGTR